MFLKFVSPHPLRHEVDTHRRSQSKFRKARSKIELQQGCVPQLDLVFARFALQIPNRPYALNFEPMRPGIFSWHRGAEILSSTSSWSLSYPYLILRGRPCIFSVLVNIRKKEGLVNHSPHYYGVRVIILCKFDIAWSPTFDCEAILLVESYSSLAR